MAFSAGMLQRGCNTIAAGPQKNARNHISALTHFFSRHSSHKETAPLRLIRSSAYEIRTRFRKAPNRPGDCQEALGLRSRHSSSDGSRGWIARGEPQSRGVWVLHERGLERRLGPDVGFCRENSEALAAILAWLTFIRTRGQSTSRSKSKGLIKRLPVSPESSGFNELDWDFDEFRVHVFETDLDSPRTLTGCLECPPPRAWAIAAHSQVPTVVYWRRARICVIASHHSKAAAEYLCQELPCWPETNGD